MTLSITTFRIIDLSVTFSIRAERHYADCHYAKCQILFIFILNVVRVGVVVLNVIMLSVVAPLHRSSYSHISFDFAKVNEALDFHRNLQRKL
jgi:hypothetical protein